MRRKSLIWHLYPYYLLVIVISLVAASWYASRSARQFNIERVTSDLEARALLVERHLAERLPDEGEWEVAPLCKELGTLSGMRITVILRNGRVICDSEEDPSRMEDHSDRPEIVQALAGLTGKSIRYSSTLKENFMYVAVPVRKGGDVVGVVRTSLPLTFIDESLRGMNIRIFIGGLVVAVIAALVSLVVARRISRPLEEIKKGAQRFAQDELHYRLPIYGLEEIGDLAEVMNDMAARLESRIETVVRQRNEQEAVFSSMVEGLLVVDMDERVKRLNEAASNFLGITPEESYGKTIQEIVRNPDLQQFVASALSSEQTVEGDFVLRGGGGERFLHAHGALLLDAGGSKQGAVIVLNDVTGLHRLEKVRRDFVANVSHELRTPITSIKGFVETLQDGAIRVPEDAEHFLGIIAKQADRMNSIIEDLLLLSRVEQDIERERFRLEENVVKDVLEEAIGVCRWKADNKNITLDLDCPDNITAQINDALIEQAVVNLIDNAIKYSEPGTRVTIKAEASPEEVTISVADQGCGIGQKHISRLFERFYRVDKARDRKLGGTGLGLAIVKHIAQAHHGRVTVESAPQVGSTFTIHLPHRA